MVTNEVSIELRYDSDFQKSVVERERPDPLTGMKIRAEDTYIFGDEDHVNSDYMATNLTVQLEAIEDILDNQKAIIEYANGPMWLVLKSHDEESVQITGCATIEEVRDPSERLSIDKSVIVSKEAWIKELIKTAEEFHAKVVKLNPNLENDQFLRQLREAIVEAKERLDVVNGGHPSEETHSERDARKDP